MRNGEIMRTRMSVDRQIAAELCQAKCGQNRNDVCVVCEVQVNTLVQWERLRTAVKCDIDLGPGVAERVILEPCDNLLLISYTDGSLCESQSVRGKNLLQGDLLPLGIGKMQSPRS
jgi:hypothetical protein